MAELREIVSGLQFPEGPIAMDDGSVVLVEIKRGTLSRVDVEKGTIDVVAECGGGPNGAAVGPDGAVYVCNNGGCFEFQEVMGMTFPGPPPASYPGHGSIQRVELGTGEVTTLYEECDGNPLPRAERHRVRHRRRLLVHRPRRAPWTHERPQRHLLRGPTGRRSRR